jgi:hypothetical protein
VRDDVATDWRGAFEAADSVDRSAESVYLCATMFANVGDETVMMMVKVA